MLAKFILTAAILAFSTPAVAQTNAQANTTPRGFIKPLTNPTQTPVTKTQTAPRRAENAEARKKPRAEPRRGKQQPAPRAAVND